MLVYWTGNSASIGVPQIKYSYSEKKMRRQARKQRKMQTERPKTDIVISPKLPLEDPTTGHNPSLLVSAHARKMNPNEISLP